jgi:hypothetical protein
MASPARDREGPTVGENKPGKASCGLVTGADFLWKAPDHFSAVELLKDDSDGALGLTLFAGSLAAVDKEKVVALLEVINHKEPLVWTSLALLFSPLLFDFARGALVAEGVYEPVHTVVDGPRDDLPNENHERSGYRDSAHDCDK